MADKHRCRLFVQRAGFVVGLTLLVAARGADAAQIPGLRVDHQGRRGGDVYQVTDLSDSGMGSLRHGIENRNGPRVIVFKVGGTIKLRASSRSASPTDDRRLTAPNPGIMIEQATVYTPALKIVATHDIVIHGSAPPACGAPASPPKRRRDDDRGRRRRTRAAEPWDDNPQACGPTLTT
jgi:hypothetical protein